MARIRTIKPEFWQSASIAALPVRVRLTFIGLWTYVDDNGVGVDNYKRVASELFGLEDDPREARTNMREDLASLHEAGRIVRYTVDGKRYLAVVNWSEHQKIDRPGKARFKSPSDEGAELLTCEDAYKRDLAEERFATPSREMRDTLAQSHLPEQGTGNREQGEDTPASVAEAPAEERHLRAVDATPAKRAPTDREIDSDPDFVAFWAAYPLKKDKGHARRAWVKVVRTGVDPQRITEAAQAYRDDPKRNPDFTAYPATWLNGERWDDQPAEPAPTRVGPPPFWEA